MTKYKFIKLNYYKHNTMYPEQSGGVDKEVYVRVDLIAKITPYKNSTKIRLLDGDEFEVCETAKQVMDWMNVK